MVRKKRKKILLFERRSLIDPEPVRHEVIEYNKKRKAAGMPQITNIKIKCDKKTGTCKVYGYVEYVTPESKTASED